ncbi:methyltransferase domain-containing protein [Bradyrhizobium canariense]|uniref:Methyltransferase domain-containing protein n=1 Tax=Bradyrhizobium canariense TaxID=255045 RepID=A0A1H1QFJ7_9BRAD|nr:methyltransferase domain-containing protein [Bradyrhizobium canariense]SDS22205.1 Methyltransferase domain-containing protein [Bradyrhizobium canariense]
MAYDKLFQYYEHEQFLPTFGNFESASKLERYALARRTVFVEKLMLPLQIFNRANVLEFGPDSGENALVFALWGANLTLAEPNLRAHGQIRNYFERFGLNDRLLRLRDDDIEGFSGEEKYDVIDAEGFIYTVQPTSLWLRVFSEKLKPGGYAIVSYYETHGTFIELVLKAIHSACKSLTGLAPEPAAQKLYETKWNSIPHTRAFSSWVRDVLENPFVRLRYFLDAPTLCRMADDHGFDLHSSWPLYRDALDIYWHKKELSAADLLKRDTGHLKRSPISFLAGQKIYLVGDADEVEAITGLVHKLVSDVDSLIEDPFGDRLPVFLSGLKALRQAVSRAAILVDDNAAMNNFETLIAALEDIFGAVQNRDIDGIVRITNSSPSFISAWGMPTHFLVLRRRFDTSPEA